MYNKDELKFLNMKTNRIGLGKVTFKIFQIENELTLEDKISFIDEIEKGMATYLLNIFDKWEIDKKGLPKDSYGHVKTVSKKAWIKRNDDRKIIDIKYKIGSYYFLGEEYKTITKICPSTGYGRDMQYTNDHIVNQWFHDLCYKLYREELNYYKTINPLHIKIEKLKEMKRYNTLFNNKIINDIVHNNKEDVTEQELDIFINAYEKLDNYVEELSKELEENLKQINLK